MGAMTTALRGTIEALDLATQGAFQEIALSMCLLWSIFRLGAAILPQTGSGSNSTMNLVARNREIKMRSWSAVDNRSRGNKSKIPQGGHEELL